MHTTALASQWLPAAEPDGSLLVVLHGRGDSSDGFTWLPRALALPGLSYLLLDAPDPYGPGLSWYDLPPHQGPGIVRSRALLERTWAELVAQGQDPRRAAQLGFSQGCLMTLDWGGRTAWPLAAFVGISGYVYDPPALLAEVHPQALRPDWLVTHGTHDDVLPFDATARDVATLQAAGWPIRFEAYRKDHTIVPEELDAVRAFLRVRFERPQS